MDKKITGQPELEPEVLHRETFVFIRGIGKIPVSVEQAVANRSEHYSVYTGKDGEQVRREDFDEDGNLKRLILTEYNPEGRVFRERVYNPGLNFYNQRRADGVLEQIDADGKFLGTVRED